MTSRSGETRISTERLQELIFDVDHEVIPDTGSEWCKLRERYKADHLSALRELAETRREYWVLVPRNATRQMLVAGGNVLKPHLDDPINNLSAAGATYRAMLAAAPKPQEGT